MERCIRNKCKKGRSINLVVIEELKSGYKRLSTWILDPSGEEGEAYKRKQPESKEDFINGVPFCAKIQGVW